MNVCLMLVIGLAIGWVTEQRVKNREIGLPGNLAVGVWGAVIGTLIFDLLGLPTYSLIGSLMMAIAGSAFLQSLVGAIEPG